MKWIALVGIALLMFYCSPKNIDKSEKNGNLSQLSSEGECDFTCLQAKAIAAENEGAFDSALEINEELRKLDPNNVTIFNTISGLHGSLGHYDQEIEWAKKALQVNPRYELAYINWGNALLAKKSYAQAKERFLQALAINPKSAPALYHLGLVADWQGQLDLALSYYQRAIAVDPTFEDPIYNAAAVLSNLRRYAEARNYLRLLLDLNPQDAQALALLQEIKFAS